MEGLKKSFLVRGNNIVGFSDKNFSTCPLGTVLSYAGQTAPNGYLLCNGALYKVADYPDLYTVIGNTYGGDTENFNVPNLVDTGQSSDLTMVYIIKAFHTNEGVDSGVSDDVINYVEGEIAEKVDKTDIATTIDDTSTDTQVPSAKAAAELKRRVVSRPAGESILDYADSIDSSKDNISVTFRAMNCPDAPYGTTGTVSNDCYYTISKLYNTNDYCVIEAKDIRTNNKYLRMKTAGTWHNWVGMLKQDNVVNMCNLSNGGHTAISSWVDDTSGTMLMSFDIVDADGKICRMQLDYNSGTFNSVKFDGTNWIFTGRNCVTKVPDVPLREVTSFSSNYSSGSVTYMVRNGECHVKVFNIKLKSAGNDLIICSGMPIPALGLVDVLAESGGSVRGSIMIDSYGNLNSHYNDSNYSLYCSFSYPVAES